MKKSFLVPVVAIGSFLLLNSILKEKSNAAASTVTTQPPQASSNAAALSSNFAQASYENISSVYGASFAQGVQNAVTTSANAAEALAKLNGGPSNNSDAAKKQDPGNRVVLRGLTIDELWRNVLSNPGLELKGTGLSRIDYYAQVTGRSVASIEKDRIDALMSNPYWRAKNGY